VLYQFEIGIARTHATPDVFPGKMHGHARSPEEMQELGARAAASAGPGKVIALVGGLGAGKTHWTKGFVAGIGSSAEVTSPTFGLVHEYPDGRLPVFHFDFYRLDSAEDLLALGWDEYTGENGVIVAEWGDKFPEILPQETTWLRFSLEPDGSRRIADGRPVN
jgi:tRNA threonylcarbamoyladenosine biosynthesis protein TsaE